MLSRRLVRPLFVIAMTLPFIVAPLDGQSDIAARQIDAGVTDADESPLGFFSRLKDAGIPTGMYIGAALWEQLRLSRTRRPADSTRTITVADAIRSFRRIHPDWSLDVSESSVVLRDAGISRRQDHIPEFRVTGIGITDAFAAAERAVDPSIPFTGGVAGSVPSTPGGPLPRLPAVLVTLQLRNVGLEDILNAICEQAPGTGWVLVRHIEGSQVFDRLSVRYPEGLRSESHWRLPVPSEPRNETLRK